jgi:hypothetical protein
MGVPPRTADVLMAPQVSDNAFDSQADAIVKVL